MKFLIIILFLFIQPLSEKTTRLILNNHIQHNSNLDLISKELFTQKTIQILDSVDINYDISSQITTVLEKEVELSKKYNKQISVFCWNYCTDKAYINDSEYVKACLQDLPKDVKFGYTLIVIDNTFKLYVLTSK